MLDTVLIALNISLTLCMEIRKSKCSRIKSNCGCFQLDLTRQVEEVEARPVDNL